MFVRSRECKYHIIHSPQGFSGIITTLVGGLCQTAKVQFTNNEGVSDDAPIHECESEIDHNTGHYVPYFLRRVCGFLTSHRFITCARACETGLTVYRRYPRRLESQTICRCHYKGSTLSSVI